MLLCPHPADAIARPPSSAGTAGEGTDPLPSEARVSQGESAHRVGGRQARLGEGIGVY
jgi:hypothetical protein